MQTYAFTRRKTLFCGRTGPEGQTTKLTNVHPTFQITPQQTRSLPYDQCKLIIDVGNSHFCFAVQLIDTKEFVGLEYYQFKEQQRDGLSQLLANHTLLQMNYAAVSIFYHGAGGLLIPDLFFSAEHAGEWLEKVNGDLHGGFPMLDKVPEINANHVYGSIAGIHEMLAEKFTNASFSHFNTGWIKKKFRKTQLPTLLELALYPSHIVVALWKDEQLQLIQHYDYDTPEDVAWWLLNLSKQWDLDQETLPILISGLLETQSPMYAEVQKYFLQVELDTRPAGFQYDFAFDNYPQHFFSPIFSLALCES